MKDLRKYLNQLIQESSKKKIYIVSPTTQKQLNNMVKQGILAVTISPTTGQKEYFTTPYAEDIIFNRYTQLLLKKSKRK